jgi:DNA-binding transcriptional ArsR family regulator
MNDRVPATGQMGAEPTDDAALLALLAAGETRSDALALALHVPPRTARYRLGRLRDRGLVEQRPRGSWTLTGAGQRAALTASVPEPVASIAVLDALPAEHRAFLRLIEDAVVARRALRDVYPSNWPGFVLVGPTKTGKTLVGRLAARRFGLDPGAAVRLLMLETPGSLLARRVQTGAATWTSVPSPLLALPLVVLDEFDKAGSELWQAAFAYLAGTSQYRVEDAVLDVAATTILTLNAERDAARLLPDAYLRRSVVLDTTPLRAVTRDLDEVAAALARVVLPQVPPDLAPPAAELPDHARRGLRRLLQDCLTDRGWELVDVEAISRLVLGRWASMAADPEAAVRSVAADYLIVTTTRVGLVVADWPACVETVVGGAITPIAATLAVARSRQAAHEEREAASARAGLDATMALAGERERLHDALDHVRQSAPRGGDLTSSERATIAVARGKAPPLRDAIAEARSLAALGELEQRLEADVLVPLGTVAGAVEARREAAVQQRQREADARRQAAAQAKLRHALLQDLYRRSTTQPGAGVLDTLLGAGCLTRQTEQYEEETLGSQVARSFIGRGLRALRAPVASPPSPAPPRDAWPPRMAPWSAWTPPQPVAPSSSEPARVYGTKTRTWYADRAGREYHAYELVAWGSPAVDAVLQAAAAAEGLPQLTRPVQRRASPRRA